MFDLAETLLWLCSIPSPTGEERLLCDTIAERLREWGLRECDLRRYGNSLYVELTRGRAGPRIALVGHTDVVRTRHDAPARIDGDRLYGAGASDMKSGLALMLGLVAEPIDTAVNIDLIFYASEEGPYVDNELGIIADCEPAIRALDFALVLEPTDNQLQLGCGGTIHAELVFTGQSAHSARPWQGKNAIYESLGVLSKLASLEPVSHLIDGLEWMASKSATLASGGRAPNVIPDRFVVNVNARFAPDQTASEVEDELRILVGSAASVTIVDSSPAAPPFRSHPLVALLESCGAMPTAPKFGWTDVARFAQLGIPAVNFGPGTLSQAHQANEWTSRQSLELGNDILRRWLLTVPPRTDRL